MTRLGEIAGLSGLMAVASVIVSVYGIEPYNTYYAWVGIGFTAVATYALISAIRLSRV